MSTHNIGFYEDLTKLSLNYHQIRTLFLLLEEHVFCNRCMKNFHAPHPTSTVHEDP